MPEGADAATFAIGDEAYVGDGVMINSRFLDGLSTEAAFEAVGEPACGSNARQRAAGRAQGQLPPARLGHFAPALLGLPDPGRSIARTAASCRCRRPTCRSGCPTTSPSTGPATRSTVIRPGAMSPARNAARTRGARPTRWTRSSIRPGTSPASPRPGRAGRPIRPPPTPGCRSTSISAGSSTRSCTCSIPASSPAPCR